MWRMAAWRPPRRWLSSNGMPDPCPTMLSGSSAGWIRPTPQRCELNCANDSRSGANCNEHDRTASGLRYESTDDVAGRLRRTDETPRRHFDCDDRLVRFLLCGSKIGSLFALLGTLARAPRHRHGFQ